MRASTAYHAVDYEEGCDVQDEPVRITVGRYTLNKLRDGQQSALLQLAEGPRRRDWVKGERLQAMGDSPDMRPPIVSGHSPGNHRRIHWHKRSLLTVIAVAEKRFRDITTDEVHRLGARDIEQLAGRWNNARANTQYKSQNNPKVHVLTLKFASAPGPQDWRDSARSTGGGA